MFLSSVEEVALALALPVVVGFGSCAHCRVVATASALPYFLKMPNLLQIMPAVVVAVRRRRRRRCCLLNFAFFLQKRRSDKTTRGNTRMTYTYMYYVLVTT